MSKIDELNKWLSDHKIKYQSVGAEYTIGGELYTLVEPDKLFDSDMLLLEQAKSGNTMYEFGGSYYFSRSNKMEFNILRDVGEHDSVYGEPVPFLGIHGGYEISSGSGQYDDWIKRAKFLGINCVGICEKNTLAGVMPMQSACSKAGIRFVIGATYDVLIDGMPVEIKFFVSSPVGWVSILKLNRIINVEHKEIDAAHVDKSGMIAVVSYGQSVNPKLLKWLGGFDAYFYQLDTVEYHDDDKDIAKLHECKKAIVSLKIPAVLINDAFYIHREDSGIKKLLAESARMYVEDSDDQYFKSFDDNFSAIAAMIDDDDRLQSFMESIISNTIGIAESCKFNIEVGVFKLPKYTKGSGSNEERMWNELERGLESRILPIMKKRGGTLSDDYGNTPDDYMDRMAREMDVITRGGFIDYFMILLDIVKWSHDNRILTGIGRGSAGGSLVSYLLRITHVNPMQYGLLFERFLNGGRLGKLVVEKSVEIYLENGKCIDVDFGKECLILRDGKKITVTAEELTHGDDLLSNT